MRLALQVDLFSAGVSLYELATGEMPFAGSTADEVVNEQLSFPVCYPPTLSAELRALLEVNSACMSLDQSVPFVSRSEMLSWP